MGNFFKDKLKGEESLFKEEMVFDPDYVPESYIHRNLQMQSIAMCIKPAFRESRPVNAKILGPPATGKTTAIKKLREELEGIPEGERVILVHINCQVYASKFAIFSQIHRKIFGHTPPETGVPFTRVYEAIFKRLIKENKSLIVVLDDVNYLFHDRHANEIMYDILRAHEIYPGARTAIFSIASGVDFNYKLDDKVRSMFRPQEIFFPPYNISEITDILKNRAQFGFVPGVISEGLIKDVAEYASEHGDLRVGIELLRRCGHIAEEEGSKKITSKHVKQACGVKPKATNLRRLLKSLSKDEVELFNIIANSQTDEMKSGPLYELFKGKTGQSYTKFYRILDKLESIRLIDTKFTGKGKRGRTRNIILRYEGEEILDALKKIE